MACAQVVAEAKMRQFLTDLIKPIEGLPPGSEPPWGSDEEARARREASKKRIEEQVLHGDDDDDDDEEDDDPSDYPPYRRVVRIPPARGTPL